VNPFLFKAIVGWVIIGALTLIAFAVGLHRHYRGQVVVRRGFDVRPRP